MDENEIYIQDFFGYSTFFDFNTNEEKVKDKGKFYLCSKSIVYESDNKNIPLTKYKYESIKGLPTFSTICFIQALNPSNLQSVELPLLRLTAIVLQSLSRFSKISLKKLVNNLFI
jgi:hypothetical protein